LGTELPFYFISGICGDVIVSGVENGIIQILLHKVHLTLESALKPVVVVISNVRPIEGVSLLLGNYLFG